MQKELHRVSAPRPVMGASQHTRCLLDFPEPTPNANRQREKSRRVRYPVWVIMTALHERRTSIAWRVCTPSLVFVLAACQDGPPARMADTTASAAAAAPTVSASARAAEPTLSLVAVTAERTTSQIHPDGGTATRQVRGVSFSVDARLDNAGPPLTMLTNFASIFDGVVLVIRTAAGAELERIGYTHHQSPYAEDRPLEVPTGASTKTLGFPILEWTHPDKHLQVHLEGGLRGTPYPSGLITTPKELTLP